MARDCKRHVTYAYESLFFRESEVVQVDSNYGLTEYLSKKVARYYKKVVTPVVDYCFILNAVSFPTQNIG